MPNVRIIISQEVANEAEGQALNDAVQAMYPTAQVMSTYTNQLDLPAKRAAAQEAARLAAAKAAAQITAIDRFKTWLGAEPTFDEQLRATVRRALNNAAGIVEP